MDISWKETASYIAASLQLDAVKYADRWVKGRVLDVGCGEKPFFPLFHDKVLSYTGMDTPSTIHKNHNIEVYGNGAAIPFKGSQFDSVISTSVLEHVKEPQKVMNEMARTLKKGGHLILTTPFLYGLHEQPYDFFRYSKYGLAHIAKKSGFKNVNIIPFGGVMSVMFHLIGKYIAMALYGIREAIKGNRIDASGGFHAIKKSIVIQLIAFLPQGLYRLLYIMGLKKIDNLSAQFDPCFYLLIAKK